MPRLSDLDLNQLQRTGRRTRPDDLQALTDEIRRLRSLLAAAHPHLDAVQAPQELLDELGAEVREIAADRVARAHRDRGGE